MSTDSQSPSLGFQAKLSRALDLLALWQELQLMLFLGELTTARAEGIWAAESPGVGFSPEPSLYSMVGIHPKQVEILNSTEPEVFWGGQGRI